MRKIITALFVTVALSTPASAAWDVLGAGNSSCKDWTATASTDLRSYYVSWVFGFISAAVFASDEVLKVKIALPEQNAQIIDAMDVFCKNSPESLIVHGALAVMRAMPHQGFK